MREERWNTSSSRAMCPSEVKRFLSRIRLSDGRTLLGCGRCRWKLILEDDDIGAGLPAFEAHRCEDFPVTMSLDGTL
jgi:hypothetical protein